MAKTSENVLRKTAERKKTDVSRLSPTDDCQKTFQDPLLPMFWNVAGSALRIAAAKNRLFTIIFLLVVLQVGAFAQQSTLTLKDGSVLRGYIAVQRPGQYITFCTTDADVYIDNSNALEIEERFVPFSSLPKGWQKKTSGNGDSGLYLCTISDGTSQHPMTKITERGATIRYEQHCDDTYILYWTDIQKISRDDTNLSSQSLYDKITLNDGTSYIGLVVEQRPGESTKIKLCNGEVRVLEQSNIKISSKIPKSFDIDLWKARPYTNTIVLDDGQKLTGIIVSQHIGDDAYDSYVELYKPDGTQECINFIDIEEYHNEPCQPLGQTE